MSSSDDSDTADEMDQSASGSDASRRDFLKTGATSAAAVGMGGLGGVLYVTRDEGSRVAAMPTSEGFLLVDSEKCGACYACMTSCSLTHEGEVNESLSRIQILRNPLDDAPDDITVAQCRQCVETYCVEVCPTDALSHDEEWGNVPRVEDDKCIGCQLCVEACPYAPDRMNWNFDTETGQKCDLCVDTPYWEEEGGPDGEQACVEVCPMDAIELTSSVPSQEGDRGYEVDLKPEVWGPDEWAEAMDW